MDDRCADVLEAAAEYALGLLSLEEDRVVTNHLDHCSECRMEVRCLQDIGDQLLALVPDTEPSLGFDRRVLARVAPVPRRSRGRWAVGLSVAAAVLFGVLAAVTLAGGHPARPGGSVAPLYANGIEIGSVQVEQRSPWVQMTVEAAAFSGSVTCQMIGADGSATTIGRFDLVKGSGSWGAPLTPGRPAPLGARLVAPGGGILATATFDGSAGHR
jgi:anti-sigma factor RsiW